MFVIMAFFVLLFIFNIKYYHNNFNKEYLSKKNTTIVNGFFLILVFFSHFKQYISLTSSMNIYFYKCLSLVGQLMVVPFLFFSGFGLYESKKKNNNYINDFLKKRFIPVFINFSIAVFLFLILNIIMGNRFDFLNIILSFIGWDNIGNSNWYMFDIFVLYIIFYLSFKFIKNDKYSIISIIVLSVCFIIVLSFFKEDYWYNTVIAFDIGICFSAIKNKVDYFIMNNNKRYLIFLFTSLVLFCGTYFINRIIDVPIFLNIVSVFFSLVLTLILMKYELKSKFYEYCGSLLFWIYIIQRIPMIYFKNRITNIYIYFFVCFFITLFLSFILNKAIKSIMSKKKKIKNTIYKFSYELFYNINFINYLKNIIIFESYPSLTDSPKYIFDKMIEKGLNNKYKMIWFVEDASLYQNSNINNVYYVNRNNRFKCLYYNLFAKYIIDSNTFVKKLNKNQIRIYVTHGLPMKAVRSYFETIGHVDYITVSSKFFIPLMADLYKVRIDKIAVTGLPRNDCFFEKNSMVENIIKNNITSKKYIVWLPTYRNHKNIKNDNEYNIISNFNYGVPILSDLEIINRINSELAKKEIVLFIKLHPEENTSSIKKLKLSNIIFIDDKLLSDNNIMLNEFLSYSSGLITDYSSVYYDYYATGNNIGLSIPDLDYYTKHVKLVFDDYKKNIFGNYIYTADDLVKYFEIVHSNLNKKVKDKFRYDDYHDGKSSERIIKLLGIKD